MPRTRTSPNGQARQAPAKPAEISGTAPLLEQAEAIKGVLQDALGKTRELIASLKRQEKQSKLVRSTLQSLKQLQAIDG